MPRAGRAGDDDEVALAELLAAIRRRDRYVRLRGGRFARIADDLRSRLAPLAELTCGAAGKIQVATSAAPLLEAIFDGLELDAPRAWRDLVARVTALRAVEPVAPPPP